MRGRASLAWVLCVAMTVSSATTRLRADDTAIAQALFDEGRKLAADGKCEEATAKFAASLKVQPTVGALLNLADCAEKLGRTATAWAHFEEAAALAKRKKDDRETYARDRAAALTPKLARLTLKTGAQPAGIEIRRDGALIDAAALGVAVPVDPGVHVVEATAPGHRTFRANLEVPNDGVSLELEIPTLDPIPQPSPTKIEPAPIAASKGPSQRTFALALGGVGVIGLGVGTFFGLRARSRWNEAESTCTSAGCTAAGADEGRSAQKDGVLSTIAFGVGVAAIFGASVLWLTAPDRSVGVAPTAGVGFGGVSVAGSF